MFKYKLINFIYSLFCFSLLNSSLLAQQEWKNDTLALDRIHREILSGSFSYEWLRGLCKHVGHRLSGSASYVAAVEYMKQILDTLGLDSVYTQSFMVSHWERGEPSTVRVVESPIGIFEITSLALGNTISTGPKGLMAEVVKVESLEELENMGSAHVKGKIVFFNRRFPQDLIQTFHGYGRTVDQRYNGPHLAAKMGAVACLVRSVTTAVDDLPHTGSAFYDSMGTNIPALAIGVQSADRLEKALFHGKVKLWLKSDARFLSEKTSYNVIGEIKGIEFPDHVIVIAGHLDSWDVGEGAHDDGAGCVHAVDVLHTFKRLGIRPRHTIRCVLYSNEENGLRGGQYYAEWAAQSGEKHIAAIESDRGGFSPRGFSFEGDNPGFLIAFRKVGTWSDLLEPYGISLQPGGSGADIKPLQSLGTLLVGFVPDSQRYFDFHHAASDIFENVHPRELKLGSAAITSLVYLIDKHGLE